MQVKGWIRSNYALQVHRVTSTRGEGFLFMKSSMCSNFFSVTSRRGPSTSRRQMNTPLSRRDVYFHVATSNEHPSVTSRRVFSCRDVNLSKPLSCCDVYLHVATSFLHVSVTSRRGIPTSRRGLNPLSVTSRRCLQRNPNSLAHHPCHSLPELHFALVGDPSTAHRPLVYLLESSFSAGFGS